MRYIMKGILLVRITTTRVEKGSGIDCASPVIGITQRKYEKVKGWF